ncbi:hypothetical protein P4C99_06170 [Pontiellaceae bacterium B1224]|nr:hypothetical protein [Pontiellaceae bacterium B1224]
MNAMIQTYTISRWYLMAAGAIVLAQLPAQAKEAIPSPAVLESKLESIDTELGQLATFTMRTGVGNLGWLSQDHPDPNHSEWIEIKLNEETTIDQIVLAPIIWVDENRGPVADGFPVEFRIIVGSSQYPEGQVVATYAEKDELLPRIAPLVIPLEPTKAAWVRVEATKLSPWAWNKGRYIFQLSEILIFNGDRNLALRRPARTSTSRRNKVNPSMSAKALTDGHMPYVMDAAPGKRSDPYVAFYRDDAIPTITIDLGKVHAINGINLHTADLRENIPRIHHADYAIPKHLLIEASMATNFYNAKPIMEYVRRQIYDTGPITMQNFPTTNARYIRLTVKEGYQAPEATGSWRCFGFAEIEICSDTRNMAIGREAVLNIKETNVTDGHISALTDGLNHYGTILPIREWLNQLARRHELEVIRPRIAEQLAGIYLHQEKLVATLKLLTALLAISIALAISIEYLLHRRSIRRLKQQFAADLHDEIGANLHTIGLLSDMVEEFKEAPTTISEYVKRIRAVTERTGTAIRYVTGMHDSPELFADLKTDMQRAADRIVTKQKHTLVIEGEDFIPNLKQRTRINLFLFYKECLINISRHSGATELKTELTLTPKGLVLSITDNGKGLTQDIPKSLQRRAKLFRAHVYQETPSTGGTRIILRVRRPK